MKEGIKVAFGVALLATFAADFGTRVVQEFGAPYRAVATAAPAAAPDDTKWTDKAQAGSAIFVAGFTAMLLVASVAQGRAMRRQNENLASQLLLLQNDQRPYLFVHKLSQIGAELDPGGHENQCVYFDVANHGSTPAVIDYVRVGHNIGTDGPTDPDDSDDAHPLLVSPIMAATEKREKIRHFVTDRDIKWKGIYDPEGPPPEDQEYPDGYAPVLQDGQSMYVRIIIGYHGVATTGHVTSACWRYDAVDDVFTGYGGSELNYVR